MPKAVIYNRDGTVWKQIECVEAQPYCGNFKLILIKRDDDPARRINGTQKDEHLITNLPFTVEGVDGKNWRQPEKNDPTFRVVVLSQDGEELAVYQGAKCVAFQKDLVFFNVDGTWNSAMGDVVIEPEKK